MVKGSYAVVSMLYRYCAAGTQERAARKTLQNYNCRWLPRIREIEISEVQRKGTTNSEIKNRN
jgi:hypothetical protein